MTQPASTEPVYCDHECVCVFLNQVGEPHCKHPVGKCEHDTRADGPVAQQAPAAEPFEWQFQTVCIDKPCMHLYEKCPVKSECDTLKQCEENWKFLLENPDVARENEMIRQQHDAALLTQEREKWERERAQTTASALNKQDLLSRLISIDQNAPDIRTVEQELQRTIEDIRSGAFDECNPEQCRHVIKMMKAGVSVCEKEVAQAREDVLKEAISVLESELDIRDRNWKGMKKSISLLESLRSEVGE